MKTLKEYAKIVNDLKLPVNTVILAGHNSIRRQVMGNRPDKASAEEIKAMQKYLEDAFAAGAAGWSSGLTYFPGKFADEAELKALSKVTLAHRTKESDSAKVLPERTAPSQMTAS